VENKGAQLLIITPAPGAGSYHIYRSNRAIYELTVA
jgi:hypothetical protein